MARWCSAALALTLAGACQSSRLPAPPVGRVAVVVRLPGWSGAVARLDARASTGAARALDPRADGTWGGLLELPPGRHEISLEAGAGSARPRPVTASVEVRTGELALLLATIPAPRLGRQSAPAVETLVVPRSSVVVGDELRLAASAEGRGDAAAWAWSAAPKGCGTFRPSDAAATVFTALAAGACTLGVTLGVPGAQAERLEATVGVRTRGTQVAWPLAASPSGRYLVDQRGAPVLLKGEAAWLTLVNLTEEEQEAYLSDRAAKGFNLIEVMLLNHAYTASPSPTPPADRRGEQPLLRPGDFTSPSDRYFDRAVAFVDRAARHGLMVLLFPSYLGFDGGEEGWWEPLNRPVNTRAACAAFGRYVGRRFKDRPNVLWGAGGDFEPPPGSEGEARHLEILKGIKAAGASQPWTGHWNHRHLGGISADEAAFAPAMDLDGVYQYVDVHRFAERAFDVRPPRPMFLLESRYEREGIGHDDAHPIRKAWWWTMLSGGAGVVWGNHFLWMAESARGTYVADYQNADHTRSSWAAELQSPGTFQVLLLHGFFESLPWERLIPAGPATGRRALVTSGQARGPGWIAAAATADGALLVCYLPPTGTGRRTFGLDLGALRGPARVRWFDPTTGQYLPAAAGPVAAGPASFTTPGANGSGSNDWVLLAEAP